MITINRKSPLISADEKLLVERIKDTAAKYNLDNISRTEAYFKYYKRHPEILWSFLASMVSRNAGWNMCDLEGRWFPKILKKKQRKRLFLTYERANWLIFYDAFPQLLLYEYSTKIDKPMFHLLKHFHVSAFMEQEWRRFWREKNGKRLMYALIINEQNVIQQPVIKHPLYKKRVFHTTLFRLQEWVHLNAVIFPTCDGNLFGSSIYGFNSVTKRIDLGKRLADILFAPDLYPHFYKFASTTPHTGSRYDYEQYLQPKAERTAPILRRAFPVINHHIHKCEDWSNKTKIRKKWFSETIRHKNPIQLTDWYRKKQTQIRTAIYLKEMISP